MNIKLTIPAMLLSSLALSAQAENYVFVAQDNSQETKTCIMAGNDDNAKLRRQLLSDSNSLRYSVNSISCNGLSLAQFSHKYEAWASLAFLNHHSKANNQVLGTVTIGEIAATNDRYSDDSTVFVYVSAK
jgi:hypothetical protein